MIGRLIARRLLQAVAVFLGATFLLFVMVWLLPGDEIRALFGFTRPDPQLLAELRAAYHLDDPFLVRYVRYLADLLQGDMGPLYSRQYVAAPGPQGGIGQRAINAIVGGTLPVTLRILAVAVVVELAVALPLAVVVARRKGSPLDRVVTAVTVVGVAIPGFVLASLVYVVAFDRFGAAFVEAQGWAEALLPGVVAALVPIALISSTLRPTAHELSRAPWVPRLRASGLSEGRIAWVHGARHLLPTAITMVAGEIGPTLAGLLVVEQVFRVDGLGSVLLSAVRNQQGPLVIGSVITFVAVTVLATLVADVAKVLLEPRVRSAQR